MTQTLPSNLLEKRFVYAQGGLDSSYDEHRNSTPIISELHKHQTPHLHPKLAVVLKLLELSRGDRMDHDDVREVLPQLQDD
jgi:hypothetical protein